MQNGADRIKNIIMQSISGCLIYGIFIFFISNLLFLSISAILVCLALFVSRIYIILLIRYGSGNNNIFKNVLIVGTGENGNKLIELISHTPESCLRIAGILTHKKEEIGKRIQGYMVIGSVEKVIDSLDKVSVDIILFSEDRRNYEYMDYISYLCIIQGIEFAFISDKKWYKSDIITRIKIGDLSITKFNFVFQVPEHLFLKRTFDIISSSIAISLFLPIWIVLAVYIKKDSKGPVFFRQNRIGKHGRSFMMYKFRSMVKDAEKIQDKLLYLNEMDGPAFKIKNDPRVTRIGKFLRKTSIDELPQLFNVFKGDISMVGPRPPVPKEVLQYRPWEKKRLSVVQGITCLWQISGRNEIKFDEWMNLDALFIDTWSLAIDFRILLQTIPAVISMKGAR